MTISYSSKATEDFSSHRLVAWGMAGKKSWALKEQDTR